MRHGRRNSRKKGSLERRRRRRMQWRRGWVVGSSNEEIEETKNISIYLVDNEWPSMLLLVGLTYDANC